MALSTKFTQDAEGAIASYDFFDLASNLAYKVFYAARNTTDMLITTTTESNSVRTSRNSTGSTEINFDYEFNLPMDISGPYFIVATVEVNGAAAVADEGSVSYRILKVNLDNTETEVVGTVSTGTLSSTTNLSNTYVISGEIPRTHFKKGELLRLETTFTTTVDGAASVHLWHDPAARGTPSNDSLSLTPGTQLKFVVPFKVQL